MHDQHIAGISTHWSLWHEAHSAAAETQHLAQRQLLDRYSGAIRRYLRAAVRDADGADELFQEFVIRFLGCRLRGADAGRGRLRDFLKGVLFHLVAEHHKRKRPTPLTAELRRRAVETADAQTEPEFDTSWRDELLARAWLVLQKESPSCYDVLRLRSDFPDLRAPQMAEQLSRRLEKAVTAQGVRQMLHRAREKFSESLLAEIAHSLRSPTIDDLEQELIELGLLEHCRPALERHRREHAALS